MKDYNPKTSDAEKAIGANRHFRVLTGEQIEQRNLKLEYCKTLGMHCLPDLVCDNYECEYHPDYFDGVPEIN